METYSVALRLQRVTVEYAYVSVPVTSDIVTEHEDGTARIDPTKLVQQAVEIGSASGVKWHQESVDVQPHPMQKPPEPSEVDFLP
jgi:hypothetical protein